MMNAYIKKIQNFIARGQIGEGFEIFLELISDLSSTSDELKEEVRLLTNEILLLSGKASDLDNQYTKGILEDKIYILNKNKVRHSFINLLNAIDEYPHFFNYLEELEEEDAWEIAVNKNTIEAYEAYFRNYPKGKYALETQRIIDELKANIKQRAQEERDRRKIFNNVRKNSIPSAYFTDASLSEMKDAHSEPLSIDKQTKIDVDHLQEWWKGVPDTWKKALLNEIGLIGKPKEKHIKRILKLKMLDISHNRDINQLIPIQHMTALRTLDISESNISSLTGIETLTNLESLIMVNTAVKSLEPLFKLKKFNKLIYNNINNNELVKLKNANPHCEFLHKHT